MDHFSGAGVLIIEVIEGQELQLVLFRDVSKNAYADAGGKCERVKHGNDPLKTAIEELYEESGSLLRVPGHYLSGYVDKTVGGRDGQWYRGYFLFTEALHHRDYHSNVDILAAMGAPRYLQETDDIVRIPLSILYQTLMVKHRHRKTPYVVVRGERIKLHKRVAELMRITFEDAEWILRVMDASPFGKYKRHVNRDGLIHYEYA